MIKQLMKYQNAPPQIPLFAMYIMRITVCSRLNINTAIAIHIQLMLSAAAVASIPTRTPFHWPFSILCLSYCCIVLTHKCTQNFHRTKYFWWCEYTQTHAMHGSYGINFSFLFLSFAINGILILCVCILYRLILAHGHSKFFPFKTECVNELNGRNG